MDLLSLASSPGPNAAAVTSAVALAAVALMLRDRLRWLYVMLSLAVVTVVLAKNLSYNGLVSGVEGSLDAHHAYADALFWVVVAQVALGVILLLTATFSKRVKWLAVVAALFSAYAALAMTGWRQAYLTDKPDAQYVVWQPTLHWVTLAVIAVALVVTIGSLVRSRRRPAVTP